LPQEIWFKNFLKSGENDSIGEFGNFSFEELVEVPVVMSAKKGDRLFDAPSGAYVFDEEAINYLPAILLNQLFNRWFPPGRRKDHSKKDSNEYVFNPPLLRLSQAQWIWSVA
jgi:hypothetical protein